MDRARRLQRTMPVFNLDHIIRERYPTFLDAIRDLDDPLSMVHLFANLPQTIKVPANKTKKCAKLAKEWQHYVAETHALRKVFLSIKGIYYQAELQGVPITWLTPYSFSQQLPDDVDYRMMLTFLEFYTTLMGFVLFKLYTSIGFHYPPKLDNELADEGETLSALVLHKQDTQQALSTKTKDLGHQLQEKLKGIAEDKEDKDEKDVEKEEEEEVKELKQLSDQLLDGAVLNSAEKYASLFKDCYFFLAREVPRDSLEFVIRSFGGRVSWSGSLTGEAESSPHITHHIMDRPSQKHIFLGREYIQPQWVYDCANYCALLPTHEYAPGASLPAHLSPFVDNEAEGYVPARQQEIEAMLGKKDLANKVATEVATLTEEQEAAELEEQYAKELRQEMGGAVVLPARKRKPEDDADDYDEQAVAAEMLTSKKRWLYERVKYAQEVKKRQNENLVDKRRKLEEENQKRKSAS